MLSRPELEDLSQRVGNKSGIKFHRTLKQVKYSQMVQDDSTKKLKLRVI